MPLTALILLSVAPPGLTYFGDVRPLLEKSCFGCHAYGVKMGSLDLESWEGVQRGGNNGGIVVPGRPRESRLYTLLTGEGTPAMPMDGKVLPPSQIETVRAWIAQGALAGKPGSAPRTARLYSMTKTAGGLLVAGRFQSVELLNAASRQVVARATGPAHAVEAVAVSPDGSLIAAAGSGAGSGTGSGAGGEAGSEAGEVRLWTGSLKPKLTVTGVAGGIQALAFSPDGQMLASAASDHQVRLWHTGTGQLMRTLKGHTGAVLALAFGAAGVPGDTRLFTASTDGSVRAWNAATGLPIYALETNGALNTLALSPDGQWLATGGAAREIRLWRLGEKGATLMQKRAAHEDQVLRLTWSADGSRLASAGADGRIQIFRSSDLGVLQTHAAQPDWVYGLEFLGDGTLVAGRLDGTWAAYAP